MTMNAVVGFLLGWGLGVWMSLVLVPWSVKKINEWGKEKYMEREEKP